MSRTIVDILTDAGVTLRPGKMECPSCGERKLTASASKGVARCWGCGRAWTERGDARTPERDWAAYILSMIAEHCQDELPNAGDTLNWLASRGLPVDDLDWLHENDLGSLPGNLDVASIARKAKQLYADWADGKSTEMTTLQSQLKGPNKKSATAKLAAIEAEIAEEIAEEQANLDNTIKLLPQLNNREWVSAVVYIYRDASGTPTSLNIRDYFEEGEDRKKKIMRLQPRPNKRGLFGVTDAVYDFGEGWANRTKAKAVVVEGEHNLLSLRAVTHRWGLQWYIPVVAVGGKNGADIGALERLLDGGDPLVIFDNDRVDLATGMPGGFELVESIAARLYSWVTYTREDKDLDDYIVARPDLKPKDLYRDVIKPAEFLPIKFATIAGRVQRDLELKGLEKNDRVRRVTSTIVEDAMRRAKMFNADGLAALLMPEAEDKAEIIPAQANHARFAVLMAHYGIVDREWLAIVASAFAVRAAFADVPMTKVHSLAHWASDTHSLYLNLYDGSMVRMRIHGDEKRQVNTERVPVGTDGVLLLRSSSSAKYTPWSISDDKLGIITPGSMRTSSDSIIDRTIYASINYPSDPEKYKQIIKTWLLSLFFASEMKSKPILMFEGVGKGGKSSVGMGIGSMLMGPSFAVNNAPTTGKEVAEKMSGTPLVVWDEWDKPCKEVENAVKLLTTGGQDSRRQLYETSKVVELSCDAAVITTSNSNPIRQAGGSRRVIVIPVAPRESEGNDEVYQSLGAHLSPTLQSKRNAMWDELISDLARCIIAMANTPAETMTVFSMADFGVFFQRCANDEGWGDEARELLRWVTAQQEGQQAENRVILNLLTEKLRQCPTLIGRQMTAKEWAKYLHDIIPEHDRELKNKVQQNFFAWETKTFSDLFKARLGMQVEENKHTKVNRYSFSPPWATTPGTITVDDCYWDDDSSTNEMAVQ